jgi:hypothetical protein
MSRLSQHSLLHLRGLRAAAALACGLSVATFGQAAVPAGTVVSVEPTRLADLILLSQGFNAGLREGMVCRIQRGATDIAEVVLVELRPTCSAALILSLAPQQSIRTGDTASIKVLKS